MKPDIHQHIAEFLAAKAKGEIPEALQVIVKSWIEETPENKKEFDRLQKVWDLSGADREITSSTNEAWENVKNRITVDVHQSEVLSGAQKPPHFKIYKARNTRAFFIRRAASIAILFSIGIAIWLLSKSTFWMKLNYEKLSTTKGKIEQITLLDGTKVTLNGNSSLYYPKMFKKNKREVLLEGEAFFEVTHQPEKPFTILSGEVLTTVLGTTFNLRHIEKEGLTELLLQEGKVSFEVGDKKEIILPGEVVQFNKSKAKIAKKANENINITAWKSGILNFKETSIQQVVTVLERYYQIDFLVDNIDELHCNYTGTFNESTLDEVLEVMQLSAGFEFKINENNVVISGNFCP
ncbi:MAG: FecR domain-containing protein [Bacteroidota bacterium]